MTSVLINADDYGLTDGICRSIRLLFQHNAISNTSIMIAANGASRRCAEQGLSAIAGKAGVHLQLTGGRPISPINEVPSMVDGNSGLFLPPDQSAFCNPDEVLLEWRRQIEHVGSLLGTSPTHLDSHHGVHRIPKFTPIYLMLAQEFKLPVRGGKTVDQVVGEAYGVQTTRIAVSTWTGRGLSASELKATILGIVSALPEPGVVEIVTHPGFNDSALETISSLNRMRDNDHAVLMELARESWLKTHGIPLVRFPSLA